MSNDMKDIADLLSHRSSMCRMDMSMRQNLEYGSMLHYMMCSVSEMSHKSNRNSDRFDIIQQIHQYHNIH